MKIRNKDILNEDTHAYPKIPRALQQVVFAVNYAIENNPQEKLE